MLSPTMIGWKSKKEKRKNEKHADGCRKKIEKTRQARKEKKQ